jgi:acetyltransferase-like isoleucine patch superfamily enzyme
LHAIARYIPLLPSCRAALHRWRGVSIGKHVFIGTEVFIDDADPSLVIIEDDVTIIAQSTIVGHSYYPLHFSQILGEAGKKERTTLKKGSYIGMRSTILAGVTVGEYAIIGAGSVVTKDIPPFSVAVGVPARVVQTYSSSDLSLKG